MGWFNKGGNKEGVFLEGKTEKIHPQKSEGGKAGRSVYAAIVSYKDGKQVGEVKANPWGRKHTNN